MPSCPHCMYNRLIINDLYDNSKNICFHLYSHALITFRNRYSRNLLVFSYIFFFYKLFRLDTKQIFSGFFLAIIRIKTLYFHRMIAYKVPVVVKKIKTFLKKLFCLFLKALDSFKNVLIFDVEFYSGHIRFHIRPHEFVRTYNYMGRTCKKHVF